MKHRLFFFLFAVPRLIVGGDSDYETANSLFSNRQFSDALSHYHKAIETNSQNYQAIFRRALTYLAIGRTKPAVADLDGVLELKPDFGAARLQRANVLLKLGRLEEAKRDFEQLKKSSPSSTEVSENLQLIDENQQEIANLKNSEDCELTEEVTTRLLESHPWDSNLFRKRAKCYEAQGKLKSAIHDMKHAVKLTSDSTEFYFEMSKLEYKVGDIRDSLSSIRECLKINPDDKKCYKSYKLTRKIVKSLDSMRKSIEAGEWKRCLEAGEKLQKSNEEDVAIQMNVFRLSCRCNREEGNIGAAVQECSQVLEFDDSDVETLIQRAEAYMADEEYDLAIADYEKASELDASNEAARNGKDQAKRAKELIGKRDYYKILGVRRNANKREITKAYRKLAQKWHPDNFQDEKEKKKAEKKFIDIAAAKEVLTDEEKRRMFDNGQDPLDSDKQGGNSGFHHGFHGFNPFGGGQGGDFFFHF